MFGDEPSVIVRDISQRRRYGRRKKNSNNSIPPVQQNGHKDTSNEVCIICLETIEDHHQIWFCKSCFMETHLHCIRTWGNSQLNKNQSSWPCPLCRNEESILPAEYYCYCGKTKNPYPASNTLSRLKPHCCDNICGKIGLRSKSSHCTHPCTYTCHRGCCPPCNSIMNVFCACGSASIPIQCSMYEEFIKKLDICSRFCNKLLSCGIHSCSLKCHFGECKPCSIIDKIIYCFCGKNTKGIICGSEFSDSNFICNEKCDKLLPCKIHKCSEPCHSGPCNSCPTDPSIVTTCYCGKKSIESLSKVRESCQDPIPSCMEECGKPLICSESNFSPDPNHHTCKSLCHPDQCPPCDLTTKVKCMCKKSTIKLKCLLVFYEDNSNKSLLKCGKVCKQTLSCGKHLCSERCCTKDKDNHTCTQTCDNVFQCGHTCGRPCHKKACKPCSFTIDKQISCNCGAIVVRPPSKCGDPFPQCSNNCAFLCENGHNFFHPCHSSTTPCPPCSVNVKKYCSNDHNVLCQVECSTKVVLCSSRCSKPLICNHLCSRMCHVGDCCDQNLFKCSQLCPKEKKGCGHICKLTCHFPYPCPIRTCEEIVKLSCPCGFRKERTFCHHLANFANQRNLKITQEFIDTFRIKCSERCNANKRNFNLARALDIKSEPDSGFISTSGSILTLNDLEESFETSNFV